MTPSGPLTLKEALANPSEARALRLTTGDELVLVLPDAIATLTALEEISLDGKFERIEGSEVLASLPRLRSLHIGYRLAVVPPTLGHVAGLRQLHLRGPFDGLPDALARLTALEELHLAAPALGALPHWIGALARLRVLQASHCGIGVIPDAVGALAELTRLGLRGNRLREVPVALRRCTKLESLEVGQNQLAYLPAWLSELENLRGLSAGDNPTLRNVPAGLLRVTGRSVELARFEPAARAAQEADAARAFAILDAAAKAKERPAFVVKQSEAPKARARNWGRSHLGGLPWLAEGEGWPACTICGERMPLWLQLDAVDVPEPMRASLDGGLLQWFRCMGGPTVDRLLALHETRSDAVSPDILARMDKLVATAGSDLIRRAGAAVGPGGTSILADLQAALRAADASAADAFYLLRGPCMFFGASRVDGFQVARIIDAKGPGRALAGDESPASTFGPIHASDWEVHVDRPQLQECGVDEWSELTEELDARDDRAAAWTLPRDKLGGWPRWLQADDCETCPECGQDVRRLVYQVDGDQGPIPWGYSGVVLLLQCPAHPRQLRVITQHS